MTCRGTERDGLCAITLVSYALLLVICTSLTLGTKSFAGGSEPPSAEPIWAAKFKDLTDTVQDFGQWRGKTVILYFWATWCAPCHKEAPRLSALYEKFKDKGLVVIGLVVDNADKVRKFVKKKALKNPSVYGGSAAIQLGRDLGNAMGAIPYTVIVDQQGVVVETILGDTPDDKIESIISDLVG